MPKKKTETVPGTDSTGTSTPTSTRSRRSAASQPAADAAPKTRTSRKKAQTPAAERPPVAQPDTTLPVEQAPEAAVAPTPPRAPRRGRKAAPVEAAPFETTPAEEAPAEQSSAALAPEVEPSPTAEPTVTVRPAAKRASSRRARQSESTADTAPMQASEPEPVAEPTPAEPTPAEPEAPAPQPKRGRKLRLAPAVTEPTPEPDEAPAAVAPTPDPAPAKPARRGRRAAVPAESTAPESAAVVTAPVADAQPVAPATPEPDPVILEVPKKRGGRPRKAALPEAPLAEVLSGVEAVEATLEVTPTPAEPTPEPAPTRKRGGRKARPAAEAAALAPTPTPADQAEPLADQAQPEQAGAVHPVPDDSDEDPAAHPERDIVVAQLRKLGRPVHVRDLERTFTRQTIQRLGGWRDLTDLLEALVESGEVVRTRKKTYGLPEAMSLVRGRFQASAAGFGFVIPDSGGEDFYIPAEQTLEAWNGDIVLVRMEGRGDSRDDRGPRGSRRGQRGDGNPRASVVRIVQRAYRQLVGTLEFHHGHPILKPDDHRARHRILLLPDGLEDLQAGARVVTELFWPENTGEDEVFGQITRVLGEQDDPVTETEAVIVKFGLRGEFPEEVLAQANAIPTQIPEEALIGRLDLREFNIFTVDGRDAKDFDDAIHIQPTPEGTFVVGIHIADVSHYVQEGTPLDQEAYARATSVYMPGRVLPMLPEHVSNGVCSLVPYEDRLTMTAMVELSAEGEILKVQLAPSVINSKARLTYDEVQAYSEATATLPEHARHLEGDLHLLLKITTKLRQKRLREGALDFKLREVKVDVGPDGRMELIPIREETARGMIEDLMLLANKVVAHELLQRELPALFRIHEEPTLQRFQEVSSAIGRLGLAFPGGEPTPQAYQAVLKQVRGTPREGIVNTLLLRSMQQAKYAGENLGHFGLAFDEYLHFTSPIRRYPDLLVHRVLKGMLSGELQAGNRAVAALQARLPGMGDHTSERERAAAEAERDLTKYYQAKWAQEHLGESFHGNVSGVVASGLFVALDNGVEGKLHISHLDDDYYVYVEDAQMLRGRSRGRSYRLGDPVHVTIHAVNPLARQTDFTLADPHSPDYRPGDTQETDMDSPVKPRARRREDREQEKREKLQQLPVSEPKKFTLDDPSPRPTLSPSAGAGRPMRGRGQGTPGQGGQGQGREGRPQQGRTSFGGVGMGGGRGARRVITLERPRNEHLRPVNITVQRMYFGDWTIENMPPEDGQGGAPHGRGGRPMNGRPERGGPSGGRGFTRGGNDRGASGRLNGRPAGGARPGPTREPREASPAPATSEASGTPADDAKRRRRRRGRRGGAPGQG
ncbi:ribonuclease R [Deinococcus multiflagellatus]|uniref:ribonuclease R n=1 Tax=Deinococcus multiflagellatus TaxID=1656887 RepID=UPI001CCC2338|nr:ribonuclease R [Deinococcus multiflagellatus]MBZ9714104.1 ribonuclease R [Deinococcus multiflagellatus]